MSERKPGKGTRVQASATTNTYVYCHIASRDALKRAETEPTGAFYFCMMAGVFAAFTVEGFLNHLGQTRVQEWKTLERKLGPREKLLLLRQLLKLSADESRRSFQTLRTMLRLRDALAHGKTETVVSDRVVKGRPREEDRWPDPEWKKLCNLASAKRMVEDAEAIVRDLNTQSGSSRDPLVGLGHAWSGVSEAGVE
jgi:hypothetical protein